jgi:hypothetical protein
MNKLAIVGSVIVAILGFVGYNALSGGSKTTTTTPPVVFQAPAATPQGFQPSGMTAQQNLEATVRGNTRTIIAHSAILTKNGLVVVNTHDYKDKSANVPTVLPVALLPAGYTKDNLKGKTVIAQGTMSDYKGQPQWMATGSIEVK